MELTIKTNFFTRIGDSSVVARDQRLDNVGVQEELQMVLTGVSSFCRGLGQKALRTRDEELAALEDEVKPIHQLSIC